MIKYHFNQIGKHEFFSIEKRILSVCSGAQGEYAGLRVIRAYHEHNGAPQRKVLRFSSNLIDWIVFCRFV